MQQAKLTKIFTDKAVKVTVFAPVDYAFGNILAEGKGFFDLVPEQVLAENMVSAHIVGQPLLQRSMEDGQKLKTALTFKVKVKESQEEVFNSTWADDVHLKEENQRTLCLLLP